LLSVGRKAASKVTKTATALSSKTGLDYVVRPIQSGISSGVGHVSSSVGHMSSVAGTMTHHVMAMPSGIRRRSGLMPNSLVIQASGGNRDSFDDSYDDGDFVSSDESVGMCNAGNERQKARESDNAGQDDEEMNHHASHSYHSLIDPNSVYPEQDIDVQGPSTGKKIPDDLAEIKDKIQMLFSLVNLRNQRSEERPIPTSNSTNTCTSVNTPTLTPL
jgi:hypothetical protein